jgi:pimeloyl-ACP methyl ester carboxylesterase
VQFQNFGAASIRMWRFGEGRPLLYLHGFEGHPGDAPFLRRLAASRLVIAPEHPGFGASEGLAAMHDITDQALHFRRIIRALGARRVDVVGHCLGGMFAAELAAISPHLVRRLVLVNSYGLWDDANPLPDAFSLPPAGLAAAKWHDPEAAPAEPTPAGEDTVLARQRNLGAATKFMWPIPDRGLTRRLAFIEAPTLVIHGTSDGLVPAAYGERLASLIPNAAFCPIANAGHLPMLESEDAFTEAVSSFLGVESTPPWARRQ